MAYETCINTIDRHRIGATCFARIRNGSMVTTRNLAQFSNMINHKGFSSFDYNGYGCWCGSGTFGSQTLDATDECCRIHDECYDRIAGGFFGCWPKLVTYAWQGLSNQGIACSDKSGSCDRNTCECDKAAADCFARHRTTYNGELGRINKATKRDICNA
ncbi:unnamed protein product [Adineta ricciae]|uniref:Phospholipase A2 n=1 Tax=Adineta ricciae TaxID=249248 RepID=A0A813ZRC3_ADIRI|nr:unnamed protein product [Adineta ricciae]CAF1059603.1 unnamed protein product [Adineta ricciae]